MLNVNDVNQIYLGCQGENLARSIVIDIKPWLVEFPSGTLAIWHKRNGDETPSATGAVFDPEAGTLTWKPTSTDTYVFGEGEAEIRLSEGSVVKKSRKIKTDVAKSVTDAAGTALNSEWQDYLDAIQRAAGVSIIKDGMIKMAINSSGHLIFSYTDEVPVQTDGNSIISAVGSPTFTNLDLGPVDSYALAVSYGYTGNHQQFANMMASVDIFCGKAEKYAKGTINGEEIGPGDPAYHNNSKYYAEKAEEIAEAATGSARLMFSIRTKPESNNNYELVVSSDGIGFTPIEGYKNFLEDAPTGVGSDWQHFEENGVHIFTITYYGNNIDGYFAMTQDFVTWEHGTFYIGFREASSYTNPYIWTPQIFKYGGKYYIAATVQEGAPVSGATFYGDNIARFSGIYISEISINFVNPSISGIGSITRIEFPNIVDRLNNEYDVNDYMMDAWFVPTDQGLYCVVNDRYMLMIHSFKLASGTNPAGEYELCKTNVFGLRRIEAPTVLQISENTWKVNACTFNVGLFNGMHQNLTCFTHDFITFYDYNLMGCTDQNIDNEGTLIRMRNPSPFFMTRAQQYNILKRYDVKTHTLRIPLDAAQISLNTATAKLIKYHDVMILPGSVFAIEENVTIDDFSILPLLGNVDFIRMYAKGGNRILTYNGKQYNVSKNAEFIINPKNSDAMTLMGEQWTSVSGTDAAELKEGFSGCTITNTNIKKTGNIVTLTLDITFNVALTLNSDNIVATIKSSEYRPSLDTLYTLVYLGTATSSLGIAILKIGTSGNIVICPLESMTFPSSYKVKTTVSYISNNVG